VFFFLSKLLDVFLSPLTWVIVLVVLAVPWRRRAARRWRRKRAFGIAALAVVLLFSSGFVSDHLWQSLEDQATRTYRPDVTYDAVVLLGGVGDEFVWAERGELALNENVERLIATNRVLHEGHARVAIVSGGPVDPKLSAFSEAKLLAQHLREWGIEEDRIVIEDRARNTRENALYTAEIVRARGLQRVLVITSAFHVPRSADCFRAVGLDVDFLPVDYRSRRSIPLTFAGMLPRATALEHNSAALREILGRVIYRAQGYGKGG
jgi:uncharacterized SAM-binding protein YcdF (DUF218 family)